jgi:hypothetical protein
MKRKWITDIAVVIAFAAAGGLLGAAEALICVGIHALANGYLG